LNPTETPPSASTIHTTAYSTGTEQTEEQQTLAPHQNELLLVNVGVAAVAVVVVLFMLGKSTPN
jgi:hypothetical protein